MLTRRRLLPPRRARSLRRVHEERLVGLFYGQRALCIGALAPLNYVGTSEHSYAKLTPFRRLVHTGNAFETIYFGTRGGRPRPRLRRTSSTSGSRATLPEDAGVTPAGTPYSALRPRPDAVDGGGDRRFGPAFLRAVRPPARRRRARRAVAGLLPLRRAVRDAARPAPPIYPGFREYWDARLAGEELS